MAAGYHDFIAWLFSWKSAKPVPPTEEGVEMTLPANRPHFDGFAKPAHFTLPVNRAHFDSPEDDY